MYFFDTTIPVLSEDISSRLDLIVQTSIMVALLVILGFGFTVHVGLRVKTAGLRGVAWLFLCRGEGLGFVSSGSQALDTIQHPTEGCRLLFVVCCSVFAGV